MIKFNIRNYLFDIFIFVAILFMLPLFLYKLGQTSLVSWDEAWYAEIARNILKTGNLINLIWNGRLYTDHPPVGFIIMALFYKIFGINEFWTRFPSALSGIICIILLYLLGKKLFNPLVGLVSGIALSSAIWFLYRSRLGDLDIFLTMFFLLTILLSIYASENKRFIFPLAISIVLLLLTKTMVPLVIIPVLFLIFYKNKLYKWYELILPSVLILIVAGGWFAIQIIHDSRFINNYLGIGLRGISIKSNYLDNINLTKEYIHNGIGRWFWPATISVILSLFLKQKRLLILVIFVASFILPIIFSPKIEIWHLIPLFPILILIYFGFAFSFLEKYLPKLKYQLYTLILILSAFIYLNQIRIMWNQFIDIPAFVSDEAILSKEAGNYPQNLLVDGEYRPAALFYSEKGSITQAPKGEEDFISILKSKLEYLMITNKWRLDNPKISPQDYQIIKEDRDKVLILHILNN